VTFKTARTKLFLRDLAYHPHERPSGEREVDVPHREHEPTDAVSSATGHHADGAHPMARAFGDGRAARCSPCDPSPR